MIHSHTYLIRYVYTYPHVPDRSRSACRLIQQWPQVKFSPSAQWIHASVYKLFRPQPKLDVWSQDPEIVKRRASDLCVSLIIMRDSHLFP